MAAGGEVEPPPAPDVPAPGVLPAAPSGGGEGPLTASGATDPAFADRVGTTGASAVAQSASGANPELPNAAQSVRPVTEPDELPAIEIEAPGPLGGVPAMPRPEGLARKALDANLTGQLTERLASIIGPASAASAEHAAAVGATRAGAEQQVSRAEAGTTKEQEAATAGADREIRQIHAGWGKEKAALVEQHQSTIRSESQHARTSATQTISDANARAKAKADEAERAQKESDPGGEQSTGLWDRIKSAGRSVVSGIASAAASVVGVVRGIFDQARRAVINVLTRLNEIVKAAVDAAVRAVRAGMQRVAGAIAGALRKAQALVTRLARALISAAKAIWAAAARRLSQLWANLQASLRKALTAARRAVQLVTKALGIIKQIVKVLTNKTYAYIADLVQDPQGKIVGPIVAKAGPLAAAVPGKAEELAQQQGAVVAPQATDPAPTAAAGPSLQRTIQRKPDKAPAGEGFWDGVGRHLKAAGEQFKAEWAAMLAKVVFGILLWFPMLMEELPALWTEIKGLVMGSNEGLDRLDHLLGVSRHVINIFAGSFATVGVWALIIAWLGGPLAEGLTLAGYEGISAGIIAADLAVGLLQMGKSAHGATRPDVTPEARENYLDRFASGGMGAAITIVMVILGAIAVRFAKAVRVMKLARAEAKAAAANKGAATPPPNPIGEPTNVSSGGPNDPRPLEYPYTNPPNIRTIPPGAPLDLKSLNPRVKYLWVVDQDGNFKFAPETQNSSDFMKPLPPDKAFKIKHGDLSPGPGGTSRGPARAGGELAALRDADGNIHDLWNLNNDSSYTFARVDAEGNPLPWAPAESVDAVRDQLVRGGTDPNKLVTSDVLAGDRARAAGKVK